MEWTTDFTKKFADNEERELTLAFQLGGDINDGNTNIEETKKNILEKRFNQNDEKVIEETIQIDYTHPFGGSKKSNEMSSTKRTMKEGKNYEGGGRRKETEGMSKTNKIEIGAKIINRDREMVYSNKIDGSYANAEQFNYNQLVASSYLSTEFSLPQGLGLKTGIRYENTQTSGKWLNSSNIPFEKGYGNWLPTLIFSKSFSPMRSIKLTYNQRITRPSVQNINTNENFLDSRNYTIGNPKLKPTKTFMVGIEEMPYFIAIAPSSSVFNLTIFNLSPCSLEISSKIGPTARHGPHHSAQKSTNTGVVLFKTTCSKSAAVTLVVAIIFSFLSLYFILLSYSLIV